MASLPFANLALAGLYREAGTRVRNYYCRTECGCEWTDIWLPHSDDECPWCGARHVSPYKSEDVEVTMTNVATLKTSSRIRVLNDNFRSTFLGGQMGSLSCPWA
jgi:hypothetical protein